MLTTWTLTIDCASPSVVAAFWKVALDYVDAPPPSGFATWHDWYVACDVPREEWDDGASIVDPAGAGPRISMLKVPEAKLTKNRLHLDIQVSGGRGEPPSARSARIRDTVRRLTAVGARVLREHDIRGALDHIVLADPEGNEFCVV